jgi:hypothetical protein
VGGLEFRQVLEVMVPIADNATKRTRSNGISKRQALTQLWDYDPRVAPWKNSAFGVVQAFNTWHHHEQNGLSGDTHDARRHARADRNALRAITGETEKNDAEIMRVLADLVGA